MLLLIRFLTDLACGALNAWGGYNFLVARRYILPVLFGLMVSIVTHTWWLGLLSLPAIGTLSLGYFKGDNFGHALRLFLCAVALGLGCAIFGHLLWVLFVPYVFISGVLGGISKNWNQIIGDAINGCWLGIIILLVR